MKKKGTIIPLPTDPIRTEHLDLIPHLADLEHAASEVFRWRQEEASERLHGIVDFLENHLLPHAAAEEEVLYPAIDQAMGVADGTATMKIDHDEIARRVHHLKETVALALDVWPDQARIVDIVCQLSALSAIIVLHFRKEEGVLLPFLDAKLSMEEAETLFESMHVAHHHQS